MNVNQATPWMISEEDESGVLMVKDIDVLVATLMEMKCAAKSKKLMQSVDDLIDQLEFAPVVIQKNGMVKWQNGDFVEKETSMYPFPK